MIFAEAGCGAADAPLEQQISKDARGLDCLALEGVTVSALPRLYVEL